MSRWPGRLITKTPVTPGGTSPTASAPGVWTLPEMAYWKKQGLWPDASADVYWGYVSYLMSTSSLSNANNNLFVDSSGAFNPVTRSGNTTQGTVTPYGTLWSNYFDGSSYITMASGTAAGTGDFTIEGWFNVSSYSTGPGLYDARPNLTNGAYPAVFVDASGYLAYYVNTATQIQGATLVGLNTWNHFAVCRSGTSTRLFLNGVQQGSTYTDTNTYLMGASRPILGNNGYVPNGASQLTGYLSNIRVVNGTALYTANFTPPAATLTAISGTVLLTCQSNRFRDTSTNNVAVSVTGSARVTPYSPFVLSSPGAVYNQSDISYWSGYFNGSSYLSAPDSSGYALNSSGWSFETFVNFTSLPGSGGAASLAAQWYDGDLGWWFYLYNNAGTYQLYFSYSTNGSSQTNISVNLSAAPPLNTWNHIAYLYLSGIGVGIFWNGVQIGTFQSFGGTVFNSSSAMQIGARVGSAGAGYYLNGYLSNMRLVNAPGGSYSWPPTAPITAISGTTLLTLQSAAFTDNSTTNAVFTLVGNPLVTGNNPFQAGYYSNYFDGSGDYITAPNNAAFNFGTGDFTAECWVYQTNNTAYQRILSYGQYATGGNFQIEATSDTSITVHINGGLVSTTVPSLLNTWTHIAVVRTSGSVALYTNGVLRSTNSQAGNVSTANVFAVAGQSDGSNNFYGYISNVRIVKGTAVYTGAFTPPTTPLTAITNTSLLTCQSNRFIDNSTNNFTITVAGNTAVQSFDPFYTATVASNGGSMYFDGSGDYLSAPSSPAFQFGTNDFTIEYWVNKPAAANGAVLDARSGGTGAVPWAAYIDGSNFPYFYDGLTYTSSIAVANNAWNHVAIVRTSGVLKIFVNGSQGYSAAHTTSLNATGSLLVGGTAAYMTGYLSDIRIVKGTAVYTSAFTPPTAPLTPSANTTLLLNGMNAGTYDAAMQNNLETVGNAQVSSAQAKYGTTSTYFDGSGDYLRLPQGQNLSSGNWTIEFWVYFNSFTGTTTPHVFNFGTDSNNRYGVYRNTTGKLSFFTANSGSFDIKDGTTTVAINTWYHVAVVSNGGTRTMYVNGTSEATSTSAINAGTNWVLGFMQFGSASTDYLNGYLDDFRITKGVARYTSNFTPPTQAFPPY